MENLGYVLFGGLLGIGLWSLRSWHRREPVPARGTQTEAQLMRECRRLEQELCEWEEQASNLDDFNERMQSKKEERKEKIVRWLKEGTQLQNNEIADRLDISNRTIRRYMTELVEDGRIKQSDETGRGVFYKIVEKQG